MKIKGESIPINQKARLGWNFVQWWALVAQQGLGRIPFVP
jgi:hypothetical protein